MPAALRPVVLAALVLGLSMSLAHAYTYYRENPDGSLLGVLAPGASLNTATSAVIVHMDVAGAPESILFPQRLVKKPTTRTWKPEGGYILFLEDKEITRRLPNSGPNESRLMLPEVSATDSGFPIVILDIDEFILCAVSCTGNRFHHVYLLQHEENGEIRLIYTSHMTVEPGDEETRLIFSESLGIPANNGMPTFTGLFEEYSLSLPPEVAKRILKNNATSH